MLQPGGRQASDGFNAAGRGAIEHSRQHVEREQDGQEPDRAALPGADRHGLPPICEEAGARPGIAKFDRVVGDRHQDHGADHVGQAEAQQAPAQEVAHALALEARPDEQPGQQKHRCHEVAVVEGHQPIEPEKRLAVGVAVIGVGNDRMVDQHRDNDAAAGAVEGQIAGARDRLCFDCLSGGR